MEEPEGLVTPHFGVGGGPSLSFTVEALLEGFFHFSFYQVY